MTIRRIEVRPLSGALGAEIAGVDLAQELDEATWAEVCRAFADHLVLFFRDQQLTPAEHKAFSRRFGPLEEVPFVEPLAEHPEIIAVLKEAEERGISVFGGAWHSDFSFLEAPPLGSALYALEVPQTGGDTALGRTCVPPYDALSDGMKEAAATPAGPCTRACPMAPRGCRKTSDSAVPSRSVAATRRRTLETMHPVVRLHPDSGRNALFVNPIYTSRLEGMTEAESRPLLDYLYTHATSSLSD